MAVYRALTGLQWLIALVNADRVIVRDPIQTSTLTVLELIAHKTRRSRTLSKTGPGRDSAVVVGMSPCGPLAHFSIKVYDDIQRAALNDASIEADIPPS